MEEMFGITGSLIISAQDLRSQQFQTQKKPKARPKTSSLIDSNIRLSKHAKNTITYSTVDSKFIRAQQNEDLAAGTVNNLENSTDSKMKIEKDTEFKEERAFILKFNKVHQKSGKLDVKSQQMLRRNMSIRTRKKELLQQKKIVASKSMKMKNLLQLDKEETYYSAYGASAARDHILLSYRSKHRRLDQLKEKNQ